MKKNILILLILIVVKTGFSQTTDTAIVNKIVRDTLPINAYIVRDSIRADSMKKVNATLEAQLRDISQIIEIKRNEVSVIKGSTKKVQDSLQNELDKLTKLKAQVDTTIKQLTALNQQIFNRNDTLKNIAIGVDSLKKVQKESEDKILTNESTINKLLSEVGRKEDSLQVIAKIALKTDTKGKKYKIGIYTDRDAIVRELNAIENRKKEINDTDKLEDLRDEQLSVLTVLGPDGFKFFTSEDIVRIVDTKSWGKDIPRHYKAIDRFTVEEVRLDVNEGLIRQIVVRTNFGTYRNLTSPVDLVHIGEHLDDRLYRDGEKKYKNEYLVLGDVIQYTPVNSNSDIPYTQFDIRLYPDTAHVKDIYWIKESTSLNTYFDVAIFSDIKGLSGEANGLAQMTGSAKFITNTSNVKKTALIPLNYVSFVGGLSKFDKEFKGTFIEDDKSIDRKDLLQRATYYVGVKVNVLHWVLSPYPKRLIQDMQLNVGYNFIGSKMGTITARPDVTPKVTDTTFSNVTQNHIYIEPIISFNRFRNFNMSISLPYSLINVKKSAEITNSEFLHWIRPSIELMYYSKRNSSSKIFFRYNHWINLSDTKQAFAQMQLGYSANITDLLGSKE